MPRELSSLAAMSIARALVEHHGRIAAVVFPLSIIGGFGYTMATGSSPVPARNEQSAEGETCCVSLDRSPACVPRRLEG